MDLNIDRLALRCFNTVSWHVNNLSDGFSLWLMMMLGTVAFALGLYKVILDESLMNLATLLYHELKTNHRFKSITLEKLGSFLAGF